MELAVAIISFLIGFGAAIYFAVLNEEIAFINDHIADLEKIENWSVTYWLLEVKSGKSRSDIDSRQIAKSLEAKIRGAFYAGNFFYEKGATLLGGQFERYSELIIDLELQCTGGDFEVHQRSSDHQRTVEIMRISYELKYVLRSARKMLFLYR